MGTRRVLTAGRCRLGAALYLLARKAVPDVSDETRAEGLRRSCVANMCVRLCVCVCVFVCGCVCV